MQQLWREAQTEPADAAATVRVAQAGGRERCLQGGGLATCRIVKRVGEIAQIRGSRARNEAENAEHVRLKKQSVKFKKQKV